MRCAILVILLSIQAARATTPPAAPHKSVYDYSLVALDGKEVSLAQYKGKVLLVVALASHSIYKDQIAALDALQKAYADKGLVILGIPSSDFGSEELADNAAIQHFYIDTEHVTFPIYAKASLRGKDEIPLVKFMTDAKDGTAGGDIHWNFTKFLINREGHPILRYEADSDPADPEFKVTIEQLLDGTYKKKEPKGKEGPPAAGEEEDEDGE